MLAPTINVKTTPKSKDTTPAKPVRFITTKLAPIAVETMVKSRIIEPPMMEKPEKAFTSAMPFLPPVNVPPMYAMTKPVMMAIAAPGIFLFNTFSEKILEAYIIAPTTKKAKIKPFFDRKFVIISMI